MKGVKAKQRLLLHTTTTPHTHINVCRYISLGLPPPPPPVLPPSGEDKQSLTILVKLILQSNMNIINYNCF